MTTTERPATMCEAFQRTAAIDPDAVALRTPGGTQTLTWREYADAGATGRCRPGGFGGSAGRHRFADDGQPDRVLPARGWCPTRRRHIVFGVQHAARRATDLPVRERGHQGRDLRGAVRGPHSRQRRGHRAHRLHRRFAGRHPFGGRPLRGRARRTSTSSRPGVRCNPTTSSLSSTHRAPPETPRVWR